MSEMDAYNWVQATDGQNVQPSQTHQQQPQGYGYGYEGMTNGSTDNMFVSPYSDQARRRAFSPGYVSDYTGQAYNGVQYTHGSVPSGMPSDMAGQQHYSYNNSGMGMIPGPSGFGAQDYTNVLRGPEARAAYASASASGPGSLASSAAAAGTAASFAQNAYPAEYMSNNVTLPAGSAAGASGGVSASVPFVQMSDILAQQPTFPSGYLNNNNGNSNNTGTPAQSIGDRADDEMDIDLLDAEGSDEEPDGMLIDGEGEGDGSAHSGSDVHMDDSDAESRSGEEDAEGETDPGDSRRSSPAVNTGRARSADPGAMGWVKLEPGEKAGSSSRGDDPLNIIDQRDEVKPTPAQLASTKPKQKQNDQAPKCNFAKPRSTFSASAAPSTASAGPSKKMHPVWDLFLPSHRSHGPPKMPFTMGTYGYTLPSPSFVTSPFATQFDLDRTSASAGEAKPPKPSVRSGDGNAIAGPSTSPQKPKAKSTKPKRIRDSSQFNNPSASVSRTDPRRIAPPRPAPAKKEINMAYLRQYLVPEHIRTAKPGPLWSHLRRQGDHMDKAPRYECTPADVREIASATRSATFDYRKHLGDDYRYADMMARWLGRMMGDVEEWEMAITPMLLMLSEIDMPVNYLEPLRLRKMTKKIVKLAKEKNLGSKDAISRAADRYEDWIINRLIRGGRTIPLPGEEESSDSGSDSDSTDDGRPAGAAGSGKKRPIAKVGDVPAIKKRKLGEAAGKTAPPAVPSSALGRKASNSPSIPTTTTPTTKTLSSSFVPRAASTTATKTGSSSTTPTIPKYGTSKPIPDINMKRPNPTPAYVPRASTSSSSTATAATTGAAKPSLLAATLAKAAQPPTLSTTAAIAASSNAQAALAAVAAKLAARSDGTASAYAPASGTGKGPAWDGAVSNKKPNKKGQVVRWKEEGELVQVREFVRQQKDFDKMPWQDDTDLHGMNAHQMDINEGMTLKHEMDKEEEEVETIEWYRPEPLDPQPPHLPPTPEAIDQEQRERSILASNTGPADETGVRIIAGPADVKFHSVNHPPAPAGNSYTAGFSAPPAQAPTKSVAELLSSLGGALAIPNLNAPAVGQSTFGAPPASAPQQPQQQQPYGYHQNQNQAPYAQQNPFGPQTYGQPPPQQHQQQPYGGGGNQYQQNQHYPYQQQQQQQQPRPGYEPQDAYVSARSYGNDGWSQQGGSGWGGQGQGQGYGGGNRGGGGNGNRGGGGGGGGGNRGKQGQGKQGRQGGARVCDFFARGFCSKGDSCDYRHV